MTNSFVRSYLQAFIGVICIFVSLAGYLSGYMRIYGNITSSIDYIHIWGILASYAFIPLCIAVTAFSLFAYKENTSKFVKDTNNILLMALLVVGIIATRIFFSIPAVFMLALLYLNFKARPEKIKEYVKKSSIKEANIEKPVQKKTSKNEEGDNKKIRKVNLSNVEKNKKDEKEKTENKLKETTVEDITIVNKSIVEDKTIIANKKDILPKEDVVFIQKDIKEEFKAIKEANNTKAPIREEDLENPIEILLQANNKFCFDKPDQNNSQPKNASKENIKVNKSKLSDFNTQPVAIGNYKASNNLSHQSTNKFDELQNKENTEVKHKNVISDNNNVSKDKKQALNDVKVDMAKDLLRRDAGIDFIADLTGLSIDNINSIKESMNTKK